MQEENIKTGKVIRLNVNRAVVQVDHALTCSGADPGCPYNAMFFGVTTPKTLEVEAENVVQAKVDDWVKLALPARQLTQAVIWIYGTAILMFFLGLAFGAFVAKWFALNPELTMSFTGLAAMIVAAIAIRKLDRHYRPQYRVIQILRPGDLQRKELHPGWHGRIDKG